MDNYYVFKVEGESAYRYLGGTNHVGVWAGSQMIAYGKAKGYFKEGSTIIPVDKSNVTERIGSLH